MRLVLSIFLSSLLVPGAIAAAPQPASPPEQTAAASFVRGAPLPAWAQPLAPIPETSRKDAVVTRLAEVQAYIGKQHANLVNQVIQANDRSALPEIGQFGIDYVPAYQRFLLHRLAIIRKGQVIDHTAGASVRLLEQEATANQGVYGGATTVRILLDDVQLGDALWLTYTVEGTNPVFGNKWSDRFSIDRGTPVELRRITLLQEGGGDFNWKQAGDFKSGKIVPVVDRVGSLKRTRFEATNLEAVLREESVPVDYFPLRFLAMSEYKSWNEVARWASTLFPEAGASPQLDQLVARFAREPDDAAKAAAALQWVQDEIRYFSVSMGENSHRPQVPDVVLKRRYGDCKDKTYLLVTLLRRLGISADPVLVNAGGPRVPARLQPSTMWFDHVVVRLKLNGQAWFVDPTRTGEKGAIATRAPVLPGGAGLPVDPAASALLALPDPQTELPRYERIEKLSLESLDGPAALETRVVYRGAWASNARRVFQSFSENELRKDVLAGLEKQYSGLALVATPLLVDSADGASYEVRARFTLASPVKDGERGPSVTFKPGIMDGTLQIPDKVVRNFPFALPYGKYRAHYRMEIVWPGPVRPGAYPPVASAVDNPYFSARDEVAFRGNHLDYSFEYRVNQDEIAAAALPDMESKVDGLNQFHTVTLRRNPSYVVSAMARDIPFRDIDLVRWSGVNGKFVRGPSPRQASDPVERCDLATSAYPMSLVSGKPLAPQAFIDSIAGNSSLNGNACAAVAAFKAGQFTDAAARFKAAPALADGHEFVPLQAWAAFHAGDRAGALAHMERYARARAGEGTLNSPDIASAISLYRRAGAGIPGYLMALVPGDLEAWPRPVIAMQLGRITPGQLIAQAEALAGDGRTLALNDAWLHVAQLHLARGEIAAATEALRWYAANGIQSTGQFAHALGQLAQVERGDADVRKGLAASDAGRHAEALAHFRRAASRKHPYASYQLGIAYARGTGVAQDLAQAKHWLELAATAGSADAMHQLGVMAATGQGGPKDPGAALAWYGKAARHGHVDASYLLGLAYAFGQLGVTQDFGKAFQHYWQGAQLGNAAAQARLAAMYRSGLGRPSDPAMAYFWAERAAELGNADGMVELGLLSLFGLGTDKDPAKALALFRQAAERDSVFAMEQLAKTYWTGTGGANDSVLAHSWYLKAADKGSQEARYMLGILNQTGFSGKPDHAKAFEWFSAAARDGDMRAHAELAGQYEYGIGVARDAAAAQRHRELAGSMNEYDNLLFKLGQIFHHGEGVDRDPALAARLYRKAIDKRNRFSMDALNNLGDMYEKGAGVPRDLEKAMTMYREAARGGSGIAMYSLGTMYERGLAVAREPVLAYTYYSLSLRLGGISDNLRQNARQKQQALGTHASVAQKDEADTLAATWSKGDPLPGQAAGGAASASASGK